ncbi:MAG TPA: hypothetical protein PKE26_15765, partial [Kiritimatiellia bacterium]|nr:hypothetical protein [Kiritimatiellia bacterium]HMP00553.1 hypothetical protein [Kiritimatiellia bacterium]
MKSITQLCRLLPSILLAGFVTSGQASGQTITNIYSAAGTNTFTIPAGVTQITVQAWGGGGGARLSGTTRRAGGGGAAYA